MAANLSEELNRTLYIAGKSLVPNLRVPIYSLCAFGVPANVLCFLVLSRHGMRSSSMNCYLQFLSVYDCLFLFSWFFSLNGIGYPFIYYFTCITIAGSLFTTIGVSLERFIAVCFPLKARTWLSYKRTLLHNIFIVFTAVCFSIPRFFVKEEYSYGNIEIIVYYTQKFGPQFFPDFVGNPDFAYEKNFVLVRAAGLCVMQILVAFFNVCIYISVRKAQRLRREISQSQMKEVNLAKTVLGVVAVYLFCWTPLTFFKVACYWGITSRSVFYFLLNSNYVLSCLNSASNVIIFSLVRKDFRTAVVDMCSFKTKIPEVGSDQTTEV